MDVSDLSVDLSIDRTDIDKQGKLLLSFSPDGHKSIFSAKRLQDYLHNVEKQTHDRCESHKTLWDSNTVNAHKTCFDWAAYNDDQTVRLAALSSFAQLGYFVLSNSPAEENQVLKIVDSFGHLRDTNYGNLFEVRATINANNLAYTNAGLGAHTDNPYREPVPTIQALHCVENTVEGGESLLLDGFMAADILRRENVEHFDTLRDTRLHFRFSDNKADLRSRVPLIETDEKIRVICVRYNNRSIDTINLPQDDVLDFYAAYQHFAKILKRSELATTFRLNTGDCMVFDNTRVMHARTSFSTGGQRHVQGAYSDLDGLYSQLRLLQRRETA